MRNTNSFIRAYWVGIVISLAFLAISILTLKDFGIATDEAFHFLRGQAYFNLLSTGQNNFSQHQSYSPVLIKPGERISEFRLNDWESEYSQTNPQGINRDKIKNKNRESIYKSNYYSAEMLMNSPKEGGHPPISDILSAGTNVIFFEKLGLFDDISAYQLYILITTSIAIFAVYLYTLRSYDKVAAIVASLTLSLYPFVFSESHFNIKDIPEMSFFTVVIISFYFWVLTCKKKWFAIFMVFSLLSISTKLNAIFIPFIILPWLFYIRKTSQFRKWFSRKLIVYSLILVTFVGCGFIIFWPALWNSPIEKTLNVLIFYKDIGTSAVAGFTPYKLFGVNLLGLILVVTTMPILTLMFLVVGILNSLTGVLSKTTQNKNTRYAGVLILLWFSIPILRTMLPSASIYATLRQFAEFLPSLAIFVGIGASFLIIKLSNHLKSYSKFIPFAVVGVYVAYLVFTNLTYHPNQNLYFNFLVGGPKGALEKRVLVNWQTPNDQEFKQAVDWLNINAEPNARLAFLDGSNFSISPLWLREDISFGPYLSGMKFGGEYIIAVNYYPVPPSSLSYGLADRLLKPVYELKVKDTTILKIWKNDRKYLKEQYKQTP